MKTESIFELEKFESKIVGEEKINDEQIESENDMS